MLGKVGNVERHQLADAHPRGVQTLQEGRVAQPAGIAPVRGEEEGFHLRRQEVGRKAALLLRAGHSHGRVSLDGALAPEVSVETADGGELARDGATGEALLLKANQEAADQPVVHRFPADAGETVPRQEVEKLQEVFRVALQGVRG